MSATAQGLAVAVLQEWNHSLGFGWKTIQYSDIETDTAYIIDLDEYASGHAPSGESPTLTLGHCAAYYRYGAETSLWASVIALGGFLRERDSIEVTSCDAKRSSDSRYQYREATATVIRADKPFAVKVQLAITPERAIMLVEYDGKLEMVAHGNLLRRFADEVDCRRVLA